MGIKIFTIILIGMLHILLASKEVFGQNLNLDSVFVILEGPIEDSEKLVAGLKKSAIEYLFSNPSISQQFSKKGLEISERIGFKKGIADAYNLLGIAELEKGNFTNSITYYFKARDVYIELKDSTGIANTLSNIGNSYDHPDDLEKSNDYYIQAIAIHKKTNNKIGMGRVYNNIGINYRDIGQLDSALAYINRSLAFKRELNDSMGMGNSYDNMALIYKDLGELDLAYGYHYSAQKIRMKIGDIRGQVLSYLNIGNILILNNRYELADYNLKQGLRLADSIGLKNWKADILGNLSILEEKRGNYKVANNYFRQHMNLEIDIVKDQKSSEIEQLEVSFEIRRKDAELNFANQQLQALTSKRKFQQLLNYVIVIGAVLILCIGYIIIRSQNSKLKKAGQLKEAQEKMNQVERDNARLREKELEKELYFKNTELTSYTINFMKRNELLDELKNITESTIKSINQNGANDQAIGNLNKLKRTIINNLSTDKDWEDFKLYFEKVHQDFFTALKYNFPRLTNSDLKLCSLSRLNFTIKETASILGVSPDSIKKSRHRLRKKLSMGKNDNLLEFLMKIEENAEGLINQSS